MLVAIIMICVIGFLMMWALVSASGNCPHLVGDEVVLEKDLDLLTFKPSDEDEESEVVQYE